jgi:hypothetical protein
MLYFFDPNISRNKFNHDEIDVDKAIPTMPIG